MRRKLPCLLSVCIECIDAAEANIAIKPNQHNQIISCIISVIANSNVDPLLPYHSALCRLIFKHFVLPTPSLSLSLSLYNPDFFFSMPASTACLSLFLIESVPHFSLKMLYAVYNFRLFFGYDYVIFRDAFIFTFAWMQPSGCHFIRSFVPLFYRVACFELHTNILTERERTLSDGVDVKNTYADERRKKISTK